MLDTSINITTEQLIRIEDLDKPIYRIFPLWFLEETLRLRSLVLVSPELWEDPYEVICQHIAVQWPNGESSRQSIIKNLHPVYAQCWSMSAESDTMLRAYSRVVKDKLFRRNICPRDEGVKVRSTPRKLLEALIATTQSKYRVSCFIGSVEYLKKDELLKQIGDAIGSVGINVFEYPENRARLLLMKREEFRHEEEVRLIAVHHNENKSDTIYRIQIKPNEIFDEITFDPRLEIFERKEREAVIKKLGYKGLISESELYQGVDLQVFLAAAPQKE